MANYHLATAGPKTGAWLKCVAQPGQCPYGVARHPNEAEVIQDAIQAFKTGQRTPILIDPSGRPNKRARIKEFKFQEDGSFAFGSRAYDKFGNRIESERTKRRRKEAEFRAAFTEVFNEFPVEEVEPTDEELLAMDEAAYQAQLAKDEDRDQRFMELYWYQVGASQEQARKAAQVLRERMNAPGEDGRTVRSSLPANQRWVAKNFYRTQRRNSILNFLRTVGLMSTFLGAFFKGFDSALKSAS